MKKTKKLPEPQTLEGYRQIHPQGSWEHMRDDPINNGQQAYYDIKSTLLRGQRGLCAYCEMKVVNDLSDESIERERYRYRVEHFHNKSDLQGPVNWSLHWPNLWAVCHGGTAYSPDNRQYLEPEEINRSCDAFKAIQTNKGKLPLEAEGYILSPEEIPAYPLIFRFGLDGNIYPDEQNCANADFPNNHYPDTTTLVEKTIEHLNLGCPRLIRNRHIALGVLQKMINKKRELAPRLNSKQVRQLIMWHLFPGDANTPWCEFFSLIRWRLGEAAEEHLRSIQFDG